MASAPEASVEIPQAYLPDFCAAGTVLVVLLVAELVAIVLTLTSITAPGMFLADLATMSMYVLWLALLGTALLCRVRPRVEQLGNTQAFVFSFFLLVALSLALAELAFQLSRYFEALSLIRDSHAGFVLRSLAISTIVIALAMRYMYVSSEWRRSIVLEAQARVSALQALIRPHFLFNSMNTIASLTRSDPKLAEQAVEDLADLLRANLGGPRDRNTIRDELEVAETYQRIEKLRLGERLDVHWKVTDLPMGALIPSLTIQPLLENAIYHGIELLPDGGVVTVTGNRIGDDLQLAIVNPVAAGEQQKRGGNRMALDNIRQRFELAYGGRASVTVLESDHHFRVQLRFPLDESAA